MPRLLLGLVLLLALLPATAAAADCQFVLGFADLRGQVGSEKVGECVENEHHNPANGDALQKTTGGLLVWRKVDNVAAFTDGHRTWLAGPRGLQSRLNSQTFDWEVEGLVKVVRERLPAAAPAPCRPSDVAVESQQLRWDGAVPVVDATVTNRCKEAADVTVDAQVRAVPGDTGSQALAEMVAVLQPGRMAPGESKRIAVIAPPGLGPPQVSWLAAPLPPGARFVCLDVAASKCLRAERTLASAVYALMTVPQGRALLARAAEADVFVVRENLPGPEAAYSEPLRIVALDRDNGLVTPWPRAAWLAHELQHAAEHLAAGGGVNLERPTREECLAGEVRAFRMQADVWNGLWGGNLPPDDRLAGYLDQNVVARAAPSPALLSALVEERYREHC
jgi:hypothetical protein